MKFHYSYPLLKQKSSDAHGLCYTYRLSEILSVFQTPDDKKI